MKLLNSMKLLCCDLDLLSTVLSLTENRRIQGLSRPLSDFPVLFKADLIFKDFSRKPSKFKYFSSLCKPWIETTD